MSLVPTGPSPRRRAIWMWVSLNVVLAFALSAPAAAIVDHLTDTFGLRALMQRWLQFVSCHLIVTAFLIPRFSRRLARKDAERSARKRSR